MNTTKLNEYKEQLEQNRRRAGELLIEFATLELGYKDAADIIEDVELAIRSQTRAPKEAAGKIDLPKFKGKAKRPARNKVTPEVRVQIVDNLRANPARSNLDIGREFGIGDETIRRIRVEEGIESSAVARDRLEREAS